MPQHHRHKARRPQPQQHGDHTGRHTQDHQGRQVAHPPDRQVVIEKDGQQPQGGAGPGGDLPPQQGKQEHQRAEIEGEQYHQLEGELRQYGGPHRRTGIDQGDQPQHGYHNREGPGGKPNHSAACAAVPAGAAGEGHLLFVAPLPMEGIGDAAAQQDGHKQTVAPDEHKVHSRPSSSILRSSSKSSRLTPASTREVARAATEPPKSWSSTPRLAWAR